MADREIPTIVVVSSPSQPGAVPSAGIPGIKGWEYRMVLLELQTRNQRSPGAWQGRENPLGLGAASTCFPRVFGVLK